jgi:HYR domain
VQHCPEGFDVKLDPNEEARMLYWKEPVFQSHNHLKQVYKSKVPGDTFSAGIHYITYMATDVDGLTAKCNFRITVKGGS